MNVKERYDSLVQQLNTFVDSDVLNPTEYDEATAKFAENQRSIDLLAKREQAHRSLVTRLKTDIDNLKAENRELSYRIREFARSPYSPMKSHFRADSVRH